MRSYHGHWGPGLRSTRTWPIIFIFSMNVHCQAVSRHSRQYSFHFLLKNKLPASLPLLVSPPLCWQHEGNFYAIIAAEKEVFMLSKTQSTLLQCTQGSAQALKLMLTQYSAQWSLVRRADRRGRVNTDNSPWFCFNSGTNFDKCSQTSSHYLDRRCLPYLSCLLKMFFLLPNFPCFKPIMCQRQLLITFCALVKYGEERLQLSIWWMFSIFQENFSFRCSLSLKELW